MSTATTVPTQIRIDVETKREANELFAELGTDMTNAVNMFLKQCIAYGGIPLRIRRKRPSQELLEAMDEAERLQHDPNTEPYRTFEDYQRAMEDYVYADETA